MKKDERVSKTGRSIRNAIQELKMEENMERLGTEEAQ